MIYHSLQARQEMLLASQKHLLPDAGSGEGPLLLQRAISHVEASAAGCRGLYQGLKGICEVYDSCEDKVGAICEGAVLEYEQPEVKLVDVTCAANLLRELLFSADGGEQA